MNEKKIKRLFETARNDVVPAPPADFAEEVLRAVWRAPSAPPPVSSILDELNSLFPRLAFAAAAVIILCAATDLGLTAAGLPDIGNGVSQTAAQFLFNTEEI